MRSVVTQMRDLVPLRRMSRREALRVAERQAARLLRLCGVTTPPVLNVIRDCLPDVRVEKVDIPRAHGAVKRMAGGYWLVLLSRRLTKGSLRWSLAHEIKHILDLPFVTILYPPARGVHDLAEEACDYFAACLLMPGRWVRALWRGGVRDPRLLARRFGVTPRAMVARLLQLGLITPTNHHVVKEA